MIKKSLLCACILCTIQIFSFDNDLKKMKTTITDVFSIISNIESLKKELQKMHKEITKNIRIIKKSRTGQIEKPLKSIATQLTDIDAFGIKQALQMARIHEDLKESLVDVRSLLSSFKNVLITLEKALEPYKSILDPKQDSAGIYASFEVVIQNARQALSDLCELYNAIAPLAEDPTLQEPLDCNLIQKSGLPKPVKKKK